MNDTFLDQVARDLLRRFGNDMSHVAVVFPNKRASLFLNQALMRCGSYPTMWAPTYYTISELFQNSSDLHIADPIYLVCKLYDVYCECTGGTTETLDSFYAWGIVMLSDFDDIDKTMADASRVFQLVSDLHELDSIQYISKEQEEALRQFFSSFSKDEVQAGLKEKFLALWSKLHDIYTAFRSQLRDEHLAYEGMLCRDVVESGGLRSDCDMYCFVGFNMLQETEKRLFQRLKDDGKAMFYWDCNTEMLADNDEAGYFIRQNIQRFPNSVTAAACRQQDIVMCSSATETLQARYVRPWLLDGQRYADGARTAIVMCDERLLQPIIHSLPSETGSINITAGYPLAQTHIITLVQQQIQKNRTQDKLTLTYTLQDIVRQNMGTETLDHEAAFRTSQILQRLLDLVERDILTVDINTYKRLIAQIINTTSIPYHGEPIEGVQIMGVLETRNLDFKHVLLLSCNEGNMPKASGDTSFIPFNVRRAYGLTTSEHRDAIYSYYFQRLLTRAEDVTVLYNSSTEGTKSGEASRFMLQLMALSDRCRVIRKTLIAAMPSAAEESETHDLTNNDIEVADASTLTTAAGRSGSTADHTASAVIDVVTEQEANTGGDADATISDKPKDYTILSPTAVSNFLRCRRRYFYKYIAHIKEPEEEDEELDNRLFGLIFHAAAQLLYEKIQDSRHVVTADAIKLAQKDAALMSTVISQAIMQEYSTDAEMLQSGFVTINRAVINRLLKDMMDYDAQHYAPFTLVGNTGVEEKFTAAIPQRKDTETADTQQKRQLVYGIVDRLCEHDGTIYIIDYKTGFEMPGKIDSIDELFLPESIAKHADYYIQTMLYAIVVRHSRRLNPKRLPVVPALMYVQRLRQKIFTPLLTIGGKPVTDVAEHEEQFLEQLYNLIDIINDPTTEFTPNTTSSSCKFCKYARMCQV